MTTLDTFTRAYIEAALWSSTAYGSEDEKAAIAEGRGDSFDTSFQSANFDIDDLSPALLAHVIEDCQAFQADNADLLNKASYGRSQFSDDEMAGHDFWLTRNGHGAGFWDRGLGDIGEKLTKACKPYGEENWYVGDDGLIYGQ